MSYPMKQQRTRYGNTEGRKALQAVAILYGPARRRALPRDWRARLPDPDVYYRQHVEKLGHTNATGWAQGICPFHDDHNRSLSVNIASERGSYTCFACGAKGDLLNFHMRSTGLDFKPAIRDLLGVQP